MKRLTPVLVFAMGLLGVPFSGAIPGGGAITPDVADAQSCPATTGDLGTYGADLYVKKSNATCTAVDGGYVAPNVLYKLHVDETNGGWCQTYVYNSGQCTQSTYYSRTAVGTHQYVNPGSTSAVISANNNVQSYSTCGNGNCTGVNTLSSGTTWTQSSLGTYVYTGQTFLGGGTVGTGSQYCNMSFDFPAHQPITMNMVACAPTFRIDGWDNVQHFAPGPNPGTPITNAVYVPPALQGTALDTAVIAAVSNWNTALTASSIPVQFVRSTTLCSGPHCVLLATGVTENGGADCSDVYLPSASDSGGAVTSAVDLLVRSSDWIGWPASFLERTITHELGHGLGLKENSCTSVKSTMGTFSSCGVAMTTTDPTVTDTLPVANTTYGAGPRTSCGF